jgi:hypothetical protein
MEAARGKRLEDDGKIQHSTFNIEHSTFNIERPMSSPARMPALPV